MIVGVASVWSEEKGLSDYVRLNERLNDNEVLVLVGVTKEQAKDLPTNIVCIPRTESVDELIGWYSLANVVLSLSKAETFGITIAEAMACGTPVIVYDNTAQPELITEGTGYVAKDGDVDDVYHYIGLIKNSGAAYFQNKCRNKALEEFDNTRQFASYLQLYKTILKI